MLNVFYLDVVKVDRDVAYFVMAINICCKCTFQMFYLFFQTYVASVIWILYMFDTMLIWMLHIFAIASHVFSGVFCNCFIRMFQVFQLFRTYVASVSS